MCTRQTDSDCKTPEILKVDRRSPFETSSRTLTPRASSFSRARLNQTVGVGQRPTEVSVHTYIGVHVHPCDDGRPMTKRTDETDR
jgi:hypothetical protein